MIKKVITLLGIIICVFVIYHQTNERDVSDNNIFFSKTANSFDILRLNKNNLPEMYQDRITSSLKLFKKWFPHEVNIQFKQIDKNFNKPKSVLWREADNDKMRIIIYMNGDRIQYGVVNAWLLAFSLHPDITPRPYNDYLNIERLISEIKKIEKGDLVFLSTKDSSPSDYAQEVINDAKITEKQYLDIFSVAIFHYSILNIIGNKYKALRQNENIFTRLPQEIKRDLNFHNKNPNAWLSAFKGYQTEKHWLYIELYHYFKFAAFLLSISLCIFLFIQFFRKDLKRIIKEELEKKSITLTNRLVHKIFWKNWKCLIYQAKNSETRKAIAIIAKQIFLEIKNANQIKRTKELWSVFQDSNLPEEMLNSLRGNYEKAIRRKTSHEHREISIRILSNHLFYLLEKNNVKIDVITTRKEKKEKGYSEKERLFSQIRNLISIEENILKSLSLKKLYNLELAINLLPNIDPFALDSFLSLGIKKMLSNTRFTEALHTEDHDIIKKHLGIQDEKDNQQPKDNFIINNELLKGKKIVITGGRKVDTKRKDIVAWTYALGAEEAKYIPGSELNRVEKSSAHSDLVLLVRPVDHATLYKLKSIGANFVWINHFSQIPFTKEVMNLA